MILNNMKLGPSACEIPMGSPNFKFKTLYTDLEKVYRAVFIQTVVKRSGHDDTTVSVKSKSKLSKTIERGLRHHFVSFYLFPLLFGEALF